MKLILEVLGHRSYYIEYADTAMAFVDISNKQFFDQLKEIVIKEDSNKKKANKC